VAQVDAVFPSEVELEVGSRDEPRAALRSLAGWLRGEPLEAALWRGVVGASFAIEDWGATGLLRAERSAGDELLQAWRSG
jgi:hypothetical protein